MAKLQWVDQRLNLWAEWVGRGKRGGGAATHPMWRTVPSDGLKAEAAIPLNEEECWHTDKAVQQLPHFLRETIALYYLSGTLCVLDKMNISRSTLSQRITTAHLLLADLIGVKPISAVSLPGSFTE